ncbi:hypothetical protein ACFOD4_15465 [Pseudoroseomonas globiformis]|uniref:Uncharacterized protein n=1 Tax=Teichococcus globiformis TaxID=2307229 RepID=A0ABV7G743_9PROT
MAHPVAEGVEMENLARWILAQAFGLIGTLAVVYRDNYRVPLPAGDLGELMLRYAPQASALGFTLALWPVVDLIFRACDRQRSWQCHGDFNRWLAALLLLFLCAHAAALGLAAMSDPGTLAGALQPKVIHAYAAALLATAAMSAGYVARLEFTIWRRHNPGMETGDPP